MRLAIKCAPAQASICRGESYHQLTSAIAKISGGKVLNGKDEIDLGINAESIRLIATIIIFYNAQLLCRLYEYF
ncbi:Tn3 family transposase [Xenorhabdus cabanillasii]|uniref:Tn3 family transposase n=1 Tax=Xenorhabdus cabanillasii TaxID=351673 RepID=UPI000E25DA27